MPPEPHPDAELVARCQKGDEGAWADLVAAYGKKVYGIAWHMTYDRAEAEELTQDCFLKVWQNLDRYEPTEASLLAWIAALSRNLCIDHYRRRKREKGFSFLSDDAVTTLLPATDDPQADAVRRERVRMLLDAISELPDELAEVVILRDLDGLDYREIGDLLKLADGTVKSRLNRARIELARVVQGARRGLDGRRKVALFALRPAHHDGHGRRAMSAACRAFEQRLAEALDRAGESATAAAARALAAADAHAAECPACALLATLVAGHAGVFAFLARPEPSPEFLSRLSETPADVRARQEASEVLSFLTPGALARPEPSRALLKRLLAVPEPALFRRRVERLARRLRPAETRRDRLAVRRRGRVRGDVPDRRAPARGPDVGGPRRGERPDVRGRARAFRSARRRGPPLRRERPRPGGRPDHEAARLPRVSRVRRGPRPRRRLFAARLREGLRRSGRRPAGLARQRRNLPSTFDVLDDRWKR